jgi:hypothetical protein
MLDASGTVVTIISSPLSSSLSSGFMSLPHSLFPSVKIHDTVLSLVDASARLALLSTGINCEDSGNNDEEPDEQQLPYSVRHSWTFKLSGDTYELQVPKFGEALSDVEVVR